VLWSLRNKEKGLSGILSQDGYKKSGRTIHIKVIRQLRK